MGWRQQGVYIDLTVAPVTKRLLIALIMIFCATWWLPRLWGGSKAVDDLYTWLALIPQAVWFSGRIWQLLTYGFLHADPMHLFWNGLQLFFFSNRMERAWGARRFFRFYVICLVGSAAVVAALSPRSLTPIVGASGALFGVLVAYGLSFKNELVWFLFVPMRAGVMVMILVGMNLILLGTPDRVSYGIHLSGAVIGLLWVRGLNGFRLWGRDVRYGWAWLLAKWRLRRMRKGFKIVGRSDGSNPHRYH